MHRGLYYRYLSDRTRCEIASFMDTSHIHPNRAERSIVTWPERNVILHMILYDHMGINVGVIETIFLPSSS